METPYFAATFLEISTCITIISTNRASVAHQTRNTSRTWLSRSNFHFWCNFGPDSVSGNSLVVVVVVVLVVVIVIVIGIVIVIVTSSLSAARLVMLNNMKKRNTWDGSVRLGTDP